MIEVSPLTKAIQTVEIKREMYGDPLPNHRRIAVFWQEYLGIDISPENVAMMMVLLKIARLMETPDHHDSLVDIVGYIDCYHEIIKGEKGEKGEKGNKCIYCNNTGYIIYQNPHRIRPCSCKIGEEWEVSEKKKEGGE